MAERIGLLPLYIEGPSGTLFAVWHRPPTAEFATVLYLPPFAEEMNRSRRTIAALGRSMAARGMGLLTLDLFGTGDSAGGFEDATWDGWQADADAAIRFLQANGPPILGVMGLRTGALLALATARAFALNQVLLCQPVENGRAFMTGLLRSRVTGAQADAGPRVTTAELRNTLASGAGIELMGYPISQRLYAALETADLATIGAGFAGRVDWLRVSTRTTDEAPQKLADAMTGLGAVLSGEFNRCTVAAPSFWLLEEAPPADAFIAAATGIWAAAAGLGAAV